jgi:hypothetical protein
MTRYPPARSALVALAVALLTALLAACAQVPTSGPIEQGPVVDSGESTQFIRVIAAPPSVGADPAEIVRGFLEANASLEDDHAIARGYLTEPGSAQWQPDAGTTVYDVASLALSARGDRVRVQMDVVGELLPDGTLEVISPPIERTLTIPLEQVPDGDVPAPQWRISEPPPGILISSSDVRRAFRLYEVYFASARSEVLVPDGRMLPVVGPSLPTALAERVLAGPAQWLAQAVRTGAPPGTALALGAVPVNDGVADVQLTDQVLSATDAERRDLAAQLTWTLTQLPDVVAVRMLVGGEPLEVPGAGVEMDRSTWQARAPEALTTGASGALRAPAYLLAGASIVRVAEAGRTSIPIPNGVSEDLTGLAVSLDQRRAAAIEPDGRGLWLIPLDRSTSQRRIDGDRIGAISFDVDGQAFYIDDGQVRRVDLDAAVREVPVRAEGLGPLEGLALARDGARIALLAGGVVHVGVLTEESDSLVISSVRRVDMTIERAVDVAWSDSRSLDVLGSAMGSGLQVLRQAIGSGQVLPIGAPARPAELAAVPLSETLVATRDAEVFANVGLQWREQDPGRSVAYPG